MPIPTPIVDILRDVAEMAACVRKLLSPDDLEERPLSSRDARSDMAPPCATSAPSLAEASRSLLAASPASLDGMRIASGDCSPSLGGASDCGDTLMRAMVGEAGAALAHELECCVSYASAPIVSVDSIPSPPFRPASGLPKVAHSGEEGVSSSRCTSCRPTSTGSAFSVEEAQPIGTAGDASCKLKARAWSANFKASASSM